jgi:site-specific DNA-methyltransferase (adenine-specific)
VLDRCDYDEGEYDLYHYCPKVNSKERGDSKHPTMKPIALMTKILKLFTTPNDQLVYDPFTGSGSIGIASGTLKRDFIGSEISEEYCKLAEKRIEEKTDVK